MKPLAVEKIGKTTWRLTRNFYMNGITVPRGFVTDLATMVRTWARDADEAAVIHDYMLSTNSFARRDCDYMFYACMLDTGVRPLKAKVMFYAVRLYGLIKGLI